MRQGKKIAPARNRQGKKSYPEGCAQKPAQAARAANHDHMHDIHLTFRVCVRHTMQRAYGVLRIIAGQHHNAAAAAALQAGGVSGKFIADAEGILCGKNGVLERVVHAAQADAGERSFHRK